MNIAVIGSIHRDTIHTYQGQTFESYGGILYNLIPLATLVEGPVTIFPVCHLGTDVADTVIDVLEGYHSIDTSFINILQRKNNHAVLTYTSPQDRREELHHRLPPLTVEHLEPVYEFDVILVNFVSGTELSSSAYQTLREQSRRFLYVDLHNLVPILAGSSAGQGPVTCSRTDWIAKTHICQMNLEEAQLLSGLTVNDPLDLEPFAETLYHAGPDIVLITCGSSGALITYEAVSGLKTLLLPPVPVTPVDTTGCGDVFAASFLSSYLDVGDPVQAGHFANKTAAVKSTRRGIDGLKENTPFTSCGT